MVGEEADTSLQRRDIVVIGASAGGVEALATVVASLPGDLAAAVFIVLHMAAEGPSHLPEILARNGRLDVRFARAGDRIEHGRVYVAPPDRHLRFAAGALVLDSGPRESGHRPAIDPLFRSAAGAFGPRVVGVVLSGMRNDGTAGLAEIKRCGGVAIVQDPGDAAYPGMPQSAIAHVEVDAIARADAIAPALLRLRVLADAEGAGFPRTRGALS